MDACNTYCTEQKFLLEFMVDVAKEYALFTVDPEGRITSWNIGAERLLGYSASEVLQHHFALVFSHEDRANARPQKALVCAFTYGRCAETEYRLRKDGSRFLADMIITQLPARDTHNPQNNVHHGYAVVLRDATEMMGVLDSFRQSEEQLHLVMEQAQHIEEQRSQLLELNKEKDEILGIAAHDLKNPLMAINLSLYLLKTHWNTLPPQKIMAQIDTIDNTVDRMREIISNLLNISAIESGNITLMPEVLSATELVELVIDQYQMRAQSKNISLYFQMTDHCLYADRSATLQVVENLVSNAVKYSPHGNNVWIAVTGRDLATGDKHLLNGLAPRTTGWTQISVRDEGPGLSKDDMTKLFTKYTRLSAKPTAGEHSTGLGLSIVKKLVEAMHGRIWCESAYGSGATFTLELPAAEPISEAALFHI